MGICARGRLPLGAPYGGDSIRPRLFSARAAEDFDAFLRGPVFIYRVRAKNPRDGVKVLVRGADKKGA